MGLLFPMPRCSWTSLLTTTWPSPSHSIGLPVFSEISVPHAQHYPMVPLPAPQEPPSSSIKREGFFVEAHRSGSVPS